MIACILAGALLFVPGTQVAAPATSLVRVAASDQSGNLRDALMDKLKGMNAANTGVFHDDITPLVAPLFPPGQTFAETQAILRRQDLGQLKMFKGKQDMTDGKMYATMFMVVDGMASEVYVVIDFDFVGDNESTMVLKKTKAFLRATSM